MLLHSYEIVEGNDKVKIIGAFLSENEAEVAIEKARDLEGFRDHPNGFSIEFYEFGKLYWEEGFFTYQW